MNTISNNDQFMICAPLNNVSILVHVCMASQHLKLMTHLGSKIMQLLIGKPFQDTHGIFAFNLQTTLYFHFYYIHIKSTPKLEKCYLEVSLLSKTAKNRSLMTRLSKTETLKSETALAIKGKQVLHITASEPNLVFDSQWGLHERNKSFSEVSVSIVFIMLFLNQ